MNVGEETRQMPLRRRAAGEDEDKGRIMEKGAAGAEETCGADEWRGEGDRNRNT
jgi:hypothetical protein